MLNTLNTRVAVAFADTISTRSFAYSTTVPGTYTHIQDDCLPIVLFSEDSWWLTFSYGSSSLTRAAFKPSETGPFDPG